MSEQLKPEDRVYYAPSDSYGVVMDVLPDGKEMLVRLNGYGGGVLRCPVKGWERV